MKSHVLRLVIVAVLLPSCTYTQDVDLCKHSFHAYLCKPGAKASRRLHTGQKPDLSGENSFLLSTELRPNVPEQSRDDPVYQAPGYLPPVGGEKPPVSLVGDGSFLDPTRLLPEQVTTPKVITTQRPTTQRPTTQRPTTQRPTTQRPTTQRPTTQRPTTQRPTTQRPTTQRPTTQRPTTQRPTTQRPTTQRPTTQRPTTESNLLTDADQNKVSVRKPDEDLCKHAFHSFLCEAKKPTAAKRRRIYNGQRPGDSNLLGENSFPQPSKLLPPSVAVNAYLPPPPSTARPTTTLAYLPPRRQPELTGAASFPSLDQVNYNRQDVKEIPPLRVKPKQTDTSGSSLQSAQIAPPNKPDEDLCKHAFHSFLCAGKSGGGKQRRVHTGQSLLGANSVQNSQRLAPPPRNVYLPAASAELFQSAASDLDVHTVPAPTHKPIPGSLGGNPPIDTHRPDDAEQQVAAAAAQAPAVVASPDHHHHHDDDHHHAAGAHDHHHHHDAEHGHHHHHNITLEQLCRDPFHAFLCLNVDTSKRRLYDGNPAQDTPSSRERLQLLGAGSARQATRVDPPGNALIKQQVVTLRSQATLAPLSQAREAEEPVRFQQPNDRTAAREEQRSAQAPVRFQQNAPLPVREQQPYQPPVTEMNKPLAQAPVRFYQKNDQLEARFRQQNDQPEANFHQQNDQPEAKFRQQNDQPSARFHQQNDQPSAEYRQDKIQQTGPVNLQEVQQSQPPVRFQEPVVRAHQAEPGKPVAPRHRPAGGDDVNRRPLRRRVRPTQDVATHDRAAERRSDHGGERRIKFGDKLPRVKRLLIDAEDTVSPAVYVRGSRGVVSDSVRVRRSPEERRGNMRGQPQGLEVDTAEPEKRTVPKPEAGTEPEEVTSSAPKKTRTRLNFRPKVKKDEASSSTTEDPVVAYEREVADELKRREIEEENRKDELKRREDELKNRKDELKRREKEQEGRKAEDKRRKIEDKQRKEELKRLKEEDKEDEEEDAVEDDEEKREDADKDKLAADYEKGVREELKRREAEVLRREQEVHRREEELKRRETEEKRRKVSDKKIEEELERQRVEKIRVAEEMVRREEEEERRSEAKAKAEELL